MRYSSLFTILIYIICVFLSFTSCTSGKGEGKKAVTAKVQSAPYELLVVADKDWLKSEAGQQLVETVEAPIEGLPQVEPNFRVTYINPYAFNGTFKTYANIVVAEVDKKHTEPALLMQKNMYAQPQVVLYLYAPDNTTFVQCVEKNRSAILSMLNENEFARERRLLKKHYSGKVMTQTKKQFGVSLMAPQDIDDLKVGKDFLWSSASKQEFRQNVCLYALPMQEMTTERFVELRDSVMKINIPGGRDDQWMETDIRTVVTDQMVFEGKSVAAVRGLWDMKNDAMGGPFVCYLYTDTLNHRVLVAEGFVFAPEEKKRPIIRQLEAALQTLSFVPDTHK